MILHRQEGISKDTGMFIIRYLTDRKKKQIISHKQEGISKCLSNDTNQHEGILKNSTPNARLMKRTKPTEKKMSEFFAMIYRKIKNKGTVLYMYH